MPVPDPQIIALIGLLLAAAAYLPVLILAVRNSEGQEATAGLVSGFGILALLLTVGEALWRSGRLPGVNADYVLGVQLYACFAFSVLALLILNFFLRRGRWWGWLALAGLWAVGLTVITLSLPGLPAVIWTNGVFSLPRERLGAAWAATGWAVFILAGIVTAVSAQRKTRQPLLRNRLSYWLVIYSLLLINDLLLLRNVAPPGNLPRLAAAGLMAYAALKHHLADIRQIARRVLVYLITTLLIVGFYIAGFIFSQNLFRAAPNFSPLLTGAVIALVLALVFTPLLGVIRRLVERWLRIDEYDRGRALHEYSENIRNILNMERLATLAVGIILETMHVDRGFLFLVDREREDDGHITYRLRLARSQAERQIIPMQLDESGPIGSYFLREQRPLLQYDLDLLPIYRSAMPIEREWFSRLEAEVYVPIFAKRKWIGLLVFGSKLSGNRYTDDDLVTLSALANQTGVALENARLVENLMRLNTELRQARHALQKSNRDLQRLDQTKSDFISIASHELRTPLTVIKGYTGMLLDDHSLGPEVISAVEGIHEGALRLYEIMDSMFDIAQIDARTLDLNMEPLEMSELLSGLCNQHANALKARQQSLTIELPVLPQIKADPNSLEKVFHHLVSNAIKFTPNRGKIVITGRLVSPDGGEFPNGALEIIVSDSGVGVDPIYREIIFTKFYQPGELNQHSTSKSGFKGGGAGLGLALSKGIVEAHGGRIWVESPGYDDIHFPGSHFHVLLPLTRRPERTTTPLGAAINLTI